LFELAKFVLKAMLGELVWQRGGPSMGWSRLGDAVVLIAPCIETVLKTAFIYYFAKPGHVLSFIFSARMTFSSATRAQWFVFSL